MVNIKKDINEILYLNKEINYHLAMKGGSKTFEDIFEKYKLPINWTTYLTIFLILYYIFKTNFALLIGSELYKKATIIDDINKLNGGSLQGNSKEELNSLVSELFDNNSDKSLIDFETKGIMTKLDDFMIKTVPVLKRMANIIETQLRQGFNIWIIIPGLFSTRLINIIAILYILIIIVSVIIMFVVGNLLGNGIYIPCFGCGKSTKVFKCISGTGNGSSMCSAYKNTLSMWNSFIGAIGSIAPVADSLVSFIGRAISFIINGVVILFKAILHIFGMPGRLLDSLASGIPYITVSSDFEINLGKTLLGCEEGEDRCLYKHDSDGRNTYELNKHGATDFLKTVFDILKDFLETTPFPDLDWDLSFGGGEKSLAERKMDEEKDENLKKAKLKTDTKKIDDARAAIEGPDSIIKPIDDVELKTNDDGSVNIPKYSKKRIVKSRVTIVFEDFYNHISSLKAPEAREVFNPGSDNIISDEEYFKRYDHVAIYFNVLSYHINNKLKDKSEIEEAQRLKNRVIIYAKQLIKEKAPSERLMINPGDIAIETDSEYKKILKLSNDMYQYSLSKDEGPSEHEKTIKSDKDKSVLKKPDSEKGKEEIKSMGINDTNSAFRQFEEEQAAEEAKKLAAEKARLDEQKKLKEQKAQKDAEKGTIAAYKKELNDIQNLLGPKSDGKSSPESKNKDLLVIAYQFEEKDILAGKPKRGKSYYKKLYRKKLRELRAKKKLIKTKIQQIEDDAAKAKEENEKHFLYINLIRLLIAIRFNPLGLIASFVNAIIWVINKAIKYIIIIPLKFLINETIKMITILIEAMIDCLEIVVKEILKPLKQTIKKIKTIPITVFKMFNWIINIGPIKFIFYSIYYIVYGIVGDILPHLAIIIMTIIIISILCICPIIGFYAAFGSSVSTLFSIILNICKLIIYTIANILSNNNGLYLIKSIDNIYNYDSRNLYNDLEKLKQNILLFQYDNKSIISK